MYYKVNELKPFNAWDYVKMGIQFAKMPFAYDVQFFRQASSFAARNPIRYLKGGITALRAYVSEGFAERISKLTRENPLHADAEKHGLNFLAESPLEQGMRAEQFAVGRPVVHKLLSYGKEFKKPVGQKIAKGVRGMARWYLASERSMITSSNQFMQGLWDTQIQHWQKQGITGEKLATYKTNYADTINTFMKLLRAKSKSGQALQQAANYVLFSPSMTFSRLKRPYVMLANEGSRAYAAQLVGTEIGKIFLISALASMAGKLFKDDKGNPSVESSYDPRSTDWGQIKIGASHYDLGGGDTQFYRTLARLITGEMKNQAGLIREAPRLRTLEQYAKSRETALIGVAVEVATGRDFNGNKIWETPDWKHFTEEHKGIAAQGVAQIGEELTKNSNLDKAMFVGQRELAKSVAPQFLGDLFNAAIDAGWGTMLSTFVADTLSAGVTIYPESASTSQQKEQEKTAQIEYQKNWDDLNPTQQKVLMKKNPDIEQWKQQAKFERSEKDQEIAIKPKQLALDSTTKRAFKDAAVPYPAVSRSIGSKFYLNDDRFKKYQELATNNIKERVTLIVSKEGFKSATDEQKTKILTNQVEIAKALARRQLMQQINQATLKK
jgi:hypothetical protein